MSKSDICLGYAVELNGEVFDCKGDDAVIERVREILDNTLQDYQTITIRRTDCGHVACKGACPGCGRGTEANPGLTIECEHPKGCGYWRAWQEGYDARQAERDR